MKPTSAYSPASYRRLLKLLREGGYRFASYRDASQAHDERLVYLRHDIDYSPAWALAFAEINAEAGATGTFFFQLRSPLYNLDAYATVSAIKRICSLGQCIGLHYSVDASETGLDGLADRIAADHRALQAQIPEASPVFSWHNPSVFPGLLDKVPDVHVPGLVNTYAREFVARVKYYSESNLRHSVEELERIIRTAEPRLQLLFHPFQWLAGGRDMQEVLANTWVQVVREKEKEFLTNHVYRKALPSGMPQEWLQDLARRVAAHGKR